MTYEFNTDDEDDEQDIPAAEQIELVTAGGDEPAFGMDHATVSVYDGDAETIEEVEIEEMTIDTSGLDRDDTIDAIRTHQQKVEGSFTFEGTLDTCTTDEMRDMFGLDTEPTDYGIGNSAVEEAARRQAEKMDQTVIEAIEAGYDYLHTWTTTNTVNGRFDTHRVFEESNDPEPTERDPLGVQTYDLRDYRIVDGELYVKAPEIDL